MTDSVERFAFLLKQRPICSQSPVKTSLGPDLHRELRAKYKLELGLDLLDDRCPNAFNCISADSGCIGRPLPIDDSIRQALDELNVTVTEGVFKGRGVYFAQAVVTCSGCPFQGQCEISCVTQDSFLNRNTRPEANPPETSLVPYEDFEKGMYKALLPDDVEHCQYGEWIKEELPLDCLTPKQRQVIEMTLYEGLEQSQIADRLSIGVPRVSLHLQRAKTKLEEFGKARKIIKQYNMSGIMVDYYIHNLSQAKISKLYGTSQSNIAQSLSRWRNIHDI